MGSSAIMSREKALELLSTYVSSEHLIKHSIATEAIMRELAEELGADKDLWGLAGLLHDLDYEMTKEIPHEHGKKTAELLAPFNLPMELIHSIMRHNAEVLNLTRETPMDFALTAAETITGLIVAATLVSPEKRIAKLKAESVRKRMKSKDFARNVSREHIMLCEHLGMDIMRFIDLSIKAMQRVSESLGL
ncbi:MAG: HDIG domain-containing protein [Syntrophobacterales bacterium]|nr:HDIG domain-containing protein [Syntrophobacterales bacterium]